MVEKKKILLFSALFVVTCVLAIFYFTYQGKDKAEEYVLHAVDRDNTSTEVTTSSTISSSIIEEQESTLECSLTLEKMSDQTSVSYSKVPVYITGEVIHEGVYELSSDSIIEDVVKLAGGFTKNAAVRSINLARLVQANEHIHILSIEEWQQLLKENPQLLEQEYKVQQNASSTKSALVNSIDNEASPSLVNINTASLEELMTLPGIGEASAKAIIDYRENNSEFQTIEDIMAVPGIKDAKFQKMKEYICVG